MSVAGVTTDWTAGYVKGLEVGTRQALEFSRAHGAAAALELAKARILELEGALEVFAREAQRIDDDIPDPKDLHHYTFQAGDFRRARNALAGKRKIA